MTDDERRYFAMLKELEGMVIHLAVFGVRLTEVAKRIEHPEADSAASASLKVCRSALREAFAKAPHFAQILPVR